MADSNAMPVGAIGWTDLTVPDAEGVRDFYARVVGWKPEPVSMGDYDDFNMTRPDTGDPVVGICHSRGTNAELPSCWMLYVVVADLDASIEACRKLGGEVLAGPTAMGENSRYCVIRDPAGASLALWQTG